MNNLQKGAVSSSYEELSSLCLSKIDLKFFLKYHKRHEMLNSTANVW